MKFEPQKIRFIHVFLFMLIIAIYGYLAIGFINPDGANSTNSIEQSEVPLKIQHLAKLDSHKKDPFRSNRPVIKKTVVKAPPVKKPVITPIEIQLPHFTIQGYSDKDGKKQLTISFNNQLFFVGTGDQFAEMRLESIQSDLIEISYKNKLFKKTLPDL